jgi:hypothetical protein
LFSRLTMRLCLLFGVFSTPGAFSACEEKDDSPVVVHVLLDSSALFAKNLTRCDLQFGLTKPHLSNGKG